MKNLKIEDVVRIAALLRKYREQTIDDTELEELNEWKISNPNQFEQLTSLNYLGTKLLDLEDISVEQHLLNIHRRIDNPAKSWRYSKWGWTAAAAVLLLVVSIGGLYLFQTSKSRNHDIKENLSRSHKIDKVRLTLPNGTQVDIEDFKNGDTLTRGDVQIVNNNGIISYIDAHSKQAIAGDNIVATPTGKQFQVTLPDQTKVWLNGTSSIKYPARFAGKERLVEITGEAYFEVAKNKILPFVVLANNQKVEVLGTHFNINSYANQAAIKTTLLEGSVKVTSLALKNTTAILTPGQQAQLSNGRNIQILDNVNMNEIMAWKNEMFIFSSAPLTDILQTISNWYDVDIHYEAQIPDRYTLRVPNSTPLPILLNFLEKSGGVHFKIQNKTIIVNH